MVLCVILFYYAPKAKLVKSTLRRVRNVSWMNVIVLVMCLYHSVPLVLSLVIKSRSKTFNTDGNLITVIE